MVIKNDRFSLGNPVVKNKWDIVEFAILIFLYFVIIGKLMYISDKTDSSVIASFNFLILRFMQLHCSNINCICYNKVPERYGSAVFKQVRRSQVYMFV